MNGKEPYPSPGREPAQTEIAEKDCEQVGYLGLFGSVKEKRRVITLVTQIHTRLCYASHFKTGS